MSETKQKVREFYDSIGWKQEEDGNFQNARYEDLRPVSAEYIQNTRLRINSNLKQDGKYLLDAGSGPVQYDDYITYSNTYQKRVCLDISILALKEARNRLGDHGLFVVGDLANLPFASEVFDGIVSMHAIHHLPLDEHPKAYDELYRVLGRESTAVIVNGWSDPFLSRIGEPLIGLLRRLSGRSAKRKKDWVNEEAPEGTFVRKMTPNWLNANVADHLPLTIKPWRSMSTRYLRWFIYPELGGKQFLKIVFWLEDRFPDFFGKNGQYPMIILRK